MSTLGFLDDELRRLEAQGRRRGRRVVAERRGLELVIDGRRLVSFSSNDYLGLASDPRLGDAASRASAELGVGAAASRLVAGNFELTELLEQRLAAVHGAGSACLFNSGYSANTGVLPILAESGDVILSDELNHASIIDGCRLSRGKTVVYRHASVDDLARKLRANRARRQLVVTESVFSMDGDIAPLRELRELCDEAGAILFVDDAHAVGVLGEGGRGLGSEARADVVVGTLGKAFGASGAYVLGPPLLRELLWNRARSLVFSTGPAIPAVAAALVGVELAVGWEGAARRARLNQHLRIATERLARSVNSPIIPFVVGDDRRAMQLTEWLVTCGFFVQGIRPPTVPEGTARLRITLSGGHDPESVSDLFDRVQELMHEGAVQPYVSRET